MSLTVLPPPVPLDTLLATHSIDVKALRTELGAALPALAGGVPTDDIFLLRFVLSFDDLKARVDALRKCISWRETNAVMLADAAAKRPAPSHEILEPWMCVSPHGSGRNGSPLYIVRAGLSNPSATMSAVTGEELLANMMYWKEIAFLHCDKESRARNVLVKQVVVIDMAHVSFANTDTRYFKVIGESGKLSENVYPQLLGKSVGIHPPAFIATMMTIFKPMMSAKQLAKQSFCPGRSSNGSLSASACPFASQFFDVADLPSFLGGDCTCTSKGGCICGRPNAETKPIPAAGRAAPIVINARSNYDFLVTAREPGLTLTYNLLVQDKGIEMSAFVTPVATTTSTSAAVAPIQLFPSRKIKAEEGRVTGNVIVPCAGCVTFRLDNTYSWLVSKTVTLDVTFNKVT